MPVAKTDETTDTVTTGAEVVTDEFGTAFGAMADEVTPTDKPAETQPEKDEGAEKVDEKPDTEKTVDGEDAAKDETADATAKSETGADAKEVQPEEEKPEDYKHKYETLKGMFDKETKAFRDELKQLKEQLATKQDTPKPEPKDEGKEAEEELAKMIEEDPELKEFASEYDYLSKPLQKFLGKIIVKSKSSGSSNNEAVNDALRELHRVTITVAHSDFDELIKPEGEGKPSKLEAFVKNYTGADKDKIEHAYTNGTAREVIELVDAYKKSVKDAEAATSTVTDEVKAQREKKLNDLAAVPKKDAAINTNTKKKAETFGDAFAEEAAAAK